MGIRKTPPTFHVKLNLVRCSSVGSRPPIPPHFHWGLAAKQLHHPILAIKSETIRSGHPSRLSVSMEELQIAPDIRRLTSFAHTRIVLADAFYVPPVQMAVCFFQLRAVQKRCRHYPRGAIAFGTTGIPTSPPRHLKETTKSTVKESFSHKTLLMQFNGYFTPKKMKKSKLGFQFSKQSKEVRIVGLTGLQT